MKNVNFNRKIITIETLRAIKTTLKNKDMISGSAIEIALDDLIKLRELCSTIVQSYNEDKEHDVIKGIEFLRRIL
jgi:hypothetical protein